MKEKIYLDYAATTPLDEGVFRVMKPYFSEKFGNPGSLHSFGQEAMGAVDKSREMVAKTFGVDFRDVIFTSSATEANNLVLRGVVGSAKNISMPRVIVSAIEHDSVLKTARDLERDGLIELKVLPVDKEGTVSLSTLRKLLNDRTILVSVMYANNEMGVIQPIAEISEIIRNFRSTKSQAPNPKQVAYPLFHTDAVQALQYLACRPKEPGVDLMTISGHKIYGPKGVGALICRDGKSGIKNYELGIRSGSGGRPIHNSQFIIPSITGGGQEFGLRSGTENVANIVGLAEALRISEKIKQEEAKRIARLRNYFWEKIVLINGKARLNGPDIGGGEKSARLPNNINVYLPGVLAEEALAYLDMQGIAVSAGSACSTRASEPSHVLRAMFGDDKIARHSLRITLGRGTDRRQIDMALIVIRKLVESAC